MSALVIPRFRYFINRYVYPNNTNGITNKKLVAIMKYSPEITPSSIKIYPIEKKIKFALTENLGETGP